uniref:Zinc finger protein 235-like isoform X2 n=1 Tax=Crassostrea virginica TaxID=6565 RepID=A0A8B8DCU3_CRAVI|nr:zinc finger protein 235-like isoform X2 [Crassostrea virginica]
MQRSNAQQTQTSTLSSGQRKIETLTPARCEFFQISVDLAKGNTVVSGTKLGKQFVLGDLCKSIGVNIFAEFLNFCRERVKKERKIVVVNKTPKGTTVTGTPITNLKAIRIIPTTNSTTVLPLSNASAVTDNTAGIKIVLPVKLAANKTHLLEKNTHLESSNIQGVKRILSSTDAYTVKKRLISKDVQSNTYVDSLQQKGNAANDEEQFSAGNGLLPCELDPNVKENSLNLMKQEEDVSTESNEPILIKKEPEWEDQERGEGVHGEVTQDSSHGSCTKDVEEGSFKASESDTCTENENDPLEPSKNTDESDNEFLESSHSTSSSDNDEDLWEPPKYMTKAKQTLLRPSNKQQYQKEESAETQKTGVNSTENSIYEMPRPVCLISSNRRENTLLKLEKARVEENNRPEDEKKPREGECMIEVVYPVYPGQTVRVRKSWTCHCGETLKSQEEFVKHDKEYHKTAMKLCEHCGQFFKRKSLRSHVFRQHQPAEQKKSDGYWHLCTVCGKSYVGHASLRRHMEFIHGGKTVKCQICKKEFRAEGALRKHRLTHMNILNFVCSYCGKKFVTKFSMRSHMRVHTGEKPYECEYCGEKFNHNVSRKNHIRKAHPGKEITNQAKVFSH